MRRRIAPRSPTGDPLSIEGGRAMIEFLIALFEGFGPAGGAVVGHADVE
ncbi:hypothetical protein [Chelatococcus reniformis]|nr:hypothetical protein [Chelatococcus reniformis]